MLHTASFDVKKNRFSLFYNETWESWNTHVNKPILNDTTLFSNYRQVIFNHCNELYVVFYLQ